MRAVSTKIVELQKTGEGICKRALPVRIEWLIFLIVFAIAIAFAIYTNNAWEDFYITYRCSKNLATGNGLVYTPGERVHAFTSPLNVLIPAGLSYITGNESVMLVLWLFRLISATALGGAAVLLYQIAKSQSFKPLATFVMLGLFATNTGIVDFSINGQEVGLMMLFLAITLHALMVPGRYNWLRLGIAWAGLMWTRPDGCVYIGITAATFFLFNIGPAPTRWKLLKNYLLAGAITTVLYLPWFIWAWTYYGSPIPHTIIAKGLQDNRGFYSLSIRTISFFLGVMAGEEELRLFFGPINTHFGGWSNSVMVICGMLAWPAAWYWVLPFGKRQTRAVSLSFLMGCWYLNVLTPNPEAWYIPNTTILAIYVIGQIVEQASHFFSAFKDWFDNPIIFSRIRSLGHVLIIGVPVFSAFILLASAVELRIQQHEIEGMRTELGLWLAENKQSPRDTVFLECLGYIGYYSGLKMLDYPGLCSPEVVAARKNCLEYDFAPIISALRPDWLVLRPAEVGRVMKKDSSLLQEKYRIAKIFDATEQINSYPKFMGIGYLQYDIKFIVFKRL